MRALFKSELSHLIALNKTITLETLYKPFFHYFQNKNDNSGDEEVYLGSLNSHAHWNGSTGYWLRSTTLA